MYLWRSQEDQDLFNQRKTSINGPFCVNRTRNHVRKRFSNKQPNRSLLRRIWHYVPDNARCSNQQTRSSLVPTTLTTTPATLHKLRRRRERIRITKSSLHDPRATPKSDGIIQGLRWKHSSIHGNDDHSTTASAKTWTTPIRIPITIQTTPMTTVGP